MLNPEIYSNRPSAGFSDIWHRQRGFIVRYFFLVLLPISLAIVYFCYAKGVEYKYGRVTITHTWSHLVGGGRLEGGIRGGGGINRSARWDYTVWAETEEGRQAFLDVSTYQEFIGYHEGDSVVTRYTAHKKKGDWGWTFLAEFGLKVWLFACLILLIRIGVRHHNRSPVEKS